jgi:hypothetical protein
MFTGGCYCGAIRFETEGPASCETNCHCSICRRTTGAPYVAWFSVARAHFHFVQGSPTRFQSTAKVTRSFCCQCGTQLTFEHADTPEEVDVTTCSLDDPEQFPPKDHTHTSSKLHWIELADDLPRYREARTG